MAVRQEVTCVKKTNRTDPHDRITHIGGTGWQYTQQEAITAIESRRFDFYVRRGGRTVNVIVASRNGRKYLKTEADGEQPNNLLELPECR